MSNKDKLTQISEIGEFGLIDRISKLVSKPSNKTILGLGDDAAVLRGSNDEWLWSTDMLNEGVHFDLAYTPLAHLGYKAVTVNVSDIAAMNGIPRQVIVALGISSKFTVEAIEALYRGINQACEDYNVDLVGGDTTSSLTGLVLSVSVIGTVPEKVKTLRSGAKKGDIICVTGDLGAAYLGLQILEREKQVFEANPSMQPQLDKYQYLVERQLKPVARMDIIHELREKKIVPSSMIDISDGLASELLHLSKASGLGIKIYEEHLPIDALAYDTAVEFKIPTSTCILNGGEDYELLFTISQTDFEKLEKHPDIHFIGYMDESKGQNVMITKQENIVPLTAQGWEHFED